MSYYIIIFITSYFNMSFFFSFLQNSSIEVEYYKRRHLFP